VPDPTPPPDRRPAAVQVVNQPDGAGNMGIRGLLASMMNTTAMVLVGALLVWVLETKFVQDRADRIDDRQTFRDAVREIQTRADERAGEVKGAVDKNTEVIRELISEMRSARKFGTIPRDATLPTAPPREEP
jgi:hypothetical protein